MPIYKAPVDDVLFLLNDVFHLERYDNLPGFADASPDTVEAILREAAKLCEEVLTPLNRVGDQEGCTRHADGSVTTPNGFKDAYQQIVEGGWIGISAPEEFGGQGLPATMTAIVNEFLVLGQHGVRDVSGPDARRDRGAARAWLAGIEREISAENGRGRVDRHDEPDRAALRHRSRASAHQGGEAAGRLLQDHRHQDLHLGRRARSVGEHRSSRARAHRRRAGRHEGHLALPRAEIPASTTTARSARATASSCGSIEEKMGIHGNSTCVMNYDGAMGWLIGEENRGLNAMFMMMNEARLGVGVQGLALSEVAYQNAAIYAQGAPAGPRADRRQVPRQAGRSDHRASGRAPHADDDARLQRGGARAGALDRAARPTSRIAPQDAKERQAADDHMGLLTPVIKGVLTDKGFANTVMAQQVFGGHGYIAEQGMEQFVRDARIAMIYEGANGIQALDLVGRKLAKDGGRAVMAFFNEVQAYLKEHAGATR